MITPQSFLTHRKSLHLKIALAFVLASTVTFVAYDPPGGRNGGTWVGYGLGGVATALILWLMWFGVRKRVYTSRRSTLRGWLSAHVYLGLTLLVIIPLHSGFQFGWNVHNLAFALLAIVVASGMVGVALYAIVPELMTRNRSGERLDALFEQIADLDAEWRALAKEMPDFVAQATAIGIEKTQIGGGVFRQLSRRDRRCGTERAYQTIMDRRNEITDSGQRRRLLELITRKRALLARVRRDVRYGAAMKAWLLFHVPCAFATVATVVVHIFAVFYYR